MRLPNPISLPGAALALACAAGPAAAAPLTNGDFSAGLDGWFGQTIACSDCDGTDDVIVGLDLLPGAYDGNFSVGAEGATLETSFNADGVYDVIMYQRFDVDMLEPRNTGLALDLNIDYELSNPFLDLVIAQLTDPNGVLPTKDLLDGGPVDITEYAGRSAEILFQVIDFFGDSPDRLTVGDIRIEQVPVPAPLGLLTLGLGLLAGRRRLFFAVQPANQE